MNLDRPQRIPIENYLVGNRKSENCQITGKPFNEYEEIVLVKYDSKNFFKFSKEGFGESTNWELVDKVYKMAISGQYPRENSISKEKISKNINTLKDIIEGIYFVII